MNASENLRGLSQCELMHVIEVRAHGHWKTLSQELNLSKSRCCLMLAF